MEIDEFTYHGEKHRVTACRWPSEDVLHQYDIIIEDHDPKGNVLHYAQFFDDKSKPLRWHLDKYIRDRFPKEAP